MKELIKYSSSLGGLKDSSLFNLHKHSSMEVEEVNEIYKTWHYNFSFSRKNGKLYNDCYYIDEEGFLLDVIITPYNSISNQFIIKYQIEGEKQLHFCFYLEGKYDFTKLYGLDMSGNLRNLNNVEPSEKLKSLIFDINSNEFYASGIAVCLIDKKGSFLSLSDYYVIPDTISYDTPENRKNILSFFTEMPLNLDFDSRLLSSISPFDSNNSKFYMEGKRLFIPYGIINQCALKGSPTSYYIQVNYFKKTRYIYEVIFHSKKKGERLYISFTPNKIKLAEHIPTSTTPYGEYNIRSIPNGSLHIGDIEGEFIAYCGPYTSNRINDSFTDINSAINVAKIWEESGGEVITEPGQPPTGVDNEGGTGDRTSDIINKPEDPVIGSNLTTKSYIINLPTILGFKHFIWSTDFLEMVANYFGAPQSAIVSTLLYPFDLTQGVGDKIYEVEELRIGRMTWPLPSLAVKGYEVGWDYTKKLTVGEYKLLPFYGSFLDYAPYTTISIYLPYCGTFDIDPSLVQGKTLKVYYMFEIVSGEGKAIIESDGKEIAAYPCQLGAKMAFSSDDFKNIAANFATGIVAGSVKSIATGNPAPLVAEVGKSSIDALTTPITTQSAASMTSTIERTLVQEVYLTITRPETAVANNYNKTYGRPSLITTKLKDCKGFTSCDEVHLNIKGTNKELEMIENLLKQGVKIK